MESRGPALSCICWGAAVLRVTTVRDEGGGGSAGSSAAPGAVGSQAAPVGPPGRGGGMGTRLG